MQCRRQLTQPLCDPLSTVLTPKSESNGSNVQPPFGNCPHHRHRRSAAYYLVQFHPVVKFQMDCPVIDSTAPPKQPTIHLSPENERRLGDSVCCRVRKTMRHRCALHHLPNASLRQAIPFQRSACTCASTECLRLYSPSTFSLALSYVLFIHHLSVYIVAVDVFDLLI